MSDDKKLEVLRTELAAIASEAEEGMPKDVLTRIQALARASVVLSVHAGISVDIHFENDPTSEAYGKAVRATVAASIPIEIVTFEQQRAAG